MKKLKFFYIFYFFYFHQNIIIFNLIKKETKIKNLSKED